MGPLRDKAGDGTEGGGGTPPPFDPEAFQKSLMDAVNKTINGAIKNLKTELGRPKGEGDPKPEGDPDGDGTGTGDGAGDGKGKTDPKVKALERQLAEQRKQLDALKTEADTAKKQAQQEKRNTVLTTELSKLGVPPERMKSALRAVDPDIRFAEDGTLVGDDDTPVAEYLATWIKGNEHFLPPKPAGGAGATPGNRKGAPAVTLDDIKPGMTKEQEEAALAAIRQHFTPGGAK